MTPSILVSCYFEGGLDGMFTRLGRVLRHTAATHCAHWDRRIAPFDPPSVRPFRALSDAYRHNTQKLDYWRDAVLALPDGAQVLLLDTDTAIVRPLDDVWSRSFDVAYTVRGTYRFPLNAGVIFLRVNARSRAFISAWSAANRRMVEDKAFHQDWRWIYGGINQAALGYLLESRPQEIAGVEIVSLPCLEWNAEDSAWTKFDPAVTRILHIKSALRCHVFRISPTPDNMRPLVKFWRRLEAQALEAEKAAA